MGQFNLVSKHLNQAVLNHIIDHQPFGHIDLSTDILSAFEAAPWTQSFQFSVAQHALPLPLPPLYHMSMSNFKTALLNTATLCHSTNDLLTTTASLIHSCFDLAFPEISYPLYQFLDLFNGRNKQSEVWLAIWEATVFVEQINH